MVVCRVNYLIVACVDDVDDDEEKVTQGKENHNTYRMHLPELLVGKQRHRDSDYQELLTKNVQTPTCITR